MSKAEKTRQFIIEKTAPIFNTKGYAGTSLTDMTEATGLTKGSIYGNFSNKDEVALACFDYNLAKLNAIKKEQMDKLSSIKEKLKVRTYIFDQAILAKMPIGGCPILNTATEADDTHPRLKERVADAIENWKKKVTELLKEGIHNKEISANTDPEQVALTLISMTEGAIMVSMVTGKFSYGRSVMEAARKYIDAL
ncbi:TetR/AcrR family transcriptional regulator [Chitinophaga tropicalis]|uniref:TetR family transcriptional regulator n=1 Tax=Chitinophaga tropicalis TaxID=2683588 RepID=A0A7K1U2G7_9BACT|nr:TetR/AcrR family transcriptional regulator [Chitinophaga tropicalis]MVT08557.1 TetR family transcriptional regulator [Chitinophaga tropicalis]